jgi:hypothetical protein
LAAVFELPEDEPPEEEEEEEEPVWPADDAAPDAPDAGEGAGGPETVIARVTPRVLPPSSVKVNVTA